MGLLSAHPFTGDVAVKAAVTTTAYDWGGVDPDTGSRGLTKADVAGFSRTTSGSPGAGAVPASRPAARSWPHSPTFRTWRRWCRCSSRLTQRSSCEATVVVKPQNLYGTPAASPITPACIEACDGSLYRRNPGEIQTPGLLHANTLVEIPKDTLLAGLRDQRPRDDRPAKLLVDWVAACCDVGWCAAFGVVMQKLTVRLCAERRIPRGAQDQAVPRLVHGARRHPEDLVVIQRGRTAAQPLPQTGFDERPRLPWTRLEHGRREIEVRHRATNPIKPILARAPHEITVSGEPNRRSLRTWLWRWWSASCW